MTDEEFAQRYTITSVRGRIWTRSMVKRSAMTQVRTSPFASLQELTTQERSELINQVLDDERFMRYHTGEVPARVVEAIEERVWELVYEHQRR